MGVGCLTFIGTEGGVTFGKVPIATAIKADNEYWSAEAMLAAWGDDIPVRLHAGVFDIDQGLGLSLHQVTSAGRMSPINGRHPHQVNSLHATFDAPKSTRYRVDVLDERGAPCVGIPVEWRSGIFTSISFTSGPNGAAEFVVQDSLGEKDWTAEIPPPFCEADYRIAHPRSNKIGALRISQERRTMRVVVENLSSGIGAETVPVGAYLVPRSELAASQRSPYERRSASPTGWVPMFARWTEGGEVTFPYVGRTAPRIYVIDWCGRHLDYDADPSVLKEASLVDTTDWTNPVLRLKPRRYASLRVLGLERVDSRFAEVTLVTRRVPEPNVVVPEGHVAKLLLVDEDESDGYVNLSIESETSCCEFTVRSEELFRGRDADLRRATSVAEVRVVDATGAPVPGAVVSAWCRREPPIGGFFPTATGREGVARFLTLSTPPMSVKVVVRYRSAEYELAEAPTPLRAVVKVE